MPTASSLITLLCSSHCSVHCRVLLVLGSVLISMADSAVAQETLKLNGLFQSGMVLQQKQSAPVWGVTEAGAEVRVSGSWSKKSVSTKADADGKWQVTIDTPEAGGPYQVAVRSGAMTKTLKNVLIGEVWICSGQSNMQWKMRGFGVQHWAADVAKAKKPNIRLCNIPQVLGLEGQDDVKATWQSCNPNTVLNFSAVAYFFGSQIHEKTGVPVGLISTNWGGSSAEAWVSPEVLAKQFPEFKTQSSRYAGWIKQTGVTYQARNKPKTLNQRSPSVLYNAMIEPLVPFAFRGVIWYQGESNVKQPEQYQTLFPAMIRNWRDKWGQGDFPFYYVQIAPFHYKTNPMSTAFLREAQTMALSEPNTGMAVTMDVGNPTNIHPKLKKPVADRLARLALSRTYGMKGIVDVGPMFESSSVKGKTIELSFQGVGSGLTTNDGESPSHFMIAGSNRQFVKAEATIQGDKVVVTSEAIAKPVAVRYGWGSADMPNLSNQEGLPASSFRTDDWPIQ